ncbi:MAG: Zn-dependent hydrolase [Proteobacteria bacterium]|nr:Zn-dependent hydrolase [Pseudomonadota bacterium]
MLSKNYQPWTKVMTEERIEIEGSHLVKRIGDLAKIGVLEGGGCCRLALTDDDKKGRDLVVSWMKELELDITIDEIGNVLGKRAGTEELEPVLMGSHIDTVATGGPYDGCLGVLAGLEVIATLNRHQIKTRRPVIVGFFTNEEGARFAPDMMGSMARQGHIPLSELIDVIGIDATQVGEDLDRIGYRGKTPCKPIKGHAFFELHVEQGPVLEREGFDIGAVNAVQGISWTEIFIKGVSNHAGTTPMSMRNDAGYAAGAISSFVRDLTKEMAPYQLATIGRMEFSPNLVNVIPNMVTMTMDLRNIDEDKLREAEERAFKFMRKLEESEGVSIETKTLARFKPVNFDAGMVDLVEKEATKFGAKVKRMPSGAGHDAQSFAPTCPTSMIFVPSVDGISHNIKEFTKPEDLILGANILLNVVQIKANE